MELAGQGIRENLQRCGKMKKSTAANDSALLREHYMKSKKLNPVIMRLKYGRPWAVRKNCCETALFCGETASKGYYTYVNLILRPQNPDQEFIAEIINSLKSLEMGIKVLLIIMSLELTASIWSTLTIYDLWAR